MVSRRRFAIATGAACALLIACSGRVTPDSASPADAGLDTSTPSASPTDAGSQPDAARKAPAPTTLCADGGSSCAAAKACASDLVGWLDDGTESPGAHVFSQEQDALAFVRSLGFQGALTGDYVEFNANGEPHVFASLDDGAYVVVNGAIDPSVYRAIVRYGQCAEDAATE